MTDRDPSAQPALAREAALGLELLFELAAGEVRRRAHEGADSRGVEGAAAVAIPPYCSGQFREDRRALRLGRDDEVAIPLYCSGPGRREKREGAIRTVS
jgi:hypothetical protein